MSARLERYVMRQENLGPDLIRLSRRLGLMAGRHAQQIAHTHRLEILAWCGRRVLGEELQYLIVETQLAFCDGQSYGRGCEALTQRKEGVGSIGAVRRPPALSHHMAVPNEHEAIHKFDLRVGRLDEREEGRRRDPLCIWIAARQTSSHGRCDEGQKCDDRKRFHY